MTDEMDTVKEFMDEPDGYYLFVNSKSDDKYYLLHMDMDNNVNFLIDYGFTTTPEKLFTKIENEKYFSILKKSVFKNINFEKQIFKESDDNIRLRTLKRKLENPSYPPKKYMKIADGYKRKSKKRSKKRRSKKRSKKKSFRSRSKF
jgi:hypothetical protein